MKSGDMLMTSIDKTVIYLQFFAATSFMDIYNYNTK